MTKIEWLRSDDGRPGYTINPIKGLCPVDCKDNQGKSYCYARRMYKRFKWDTEIEWCPRVFRELDKLQSGSRVFIGSTVELFGAWVKEVWLKLIFEEIVLHPNLTFIFLTKQPQNLIKWSPFPDNCWVGVSVPHAYDDTPIGHFEAFQRISQLGKIKATVKFVSFEPLLESIASEFEFGLDLSLKAYGINWVIIGAQTPYSKKTAPRIEWVKEIVEAAEETCTPVFLKNNLRELLIPDALMDDIFWESEKAKLRQEFPQ